MPSPHRRPSHSVRVPGGASGPVRLGHQPPGSLFAPYREWADTDDETPQTPHGPGLPPREPAGASPADAGPDNTSPAEADPAGAGPPEQSPPWQSPAETRPADVTPADGRSADGRSADTGPAEAGPAGEHP